MKIVNQIRRAGSFTLPVLLVGTLAGAAPASAQEKATAQAKDSAAKTGTSIKDSWISLKVHSQFVPENALEDSDIDVDTKAGVVTLTGTVPTEAGRARAVAIAKATDGVKNVTDRLRVAPGGAAEAREAGRAAGAETKEAARKTGDKMREAGHDAKAGTKEATGTSGRAMSDGWLKSKIAAQYVTEDSLDNSDIDIDVAKGAVTLTGAVRTPAARTRAADIARKTDGVKAVKNNLKVDATVK